MSFMRIRNTFLIVTVLAVVFLLGCGQSDEKISIEVYNQGVDVADSGDYQSANAVSTKATELNPDDALGYFNSGLTYALSEQYGKAIGNYTKYIVLNPEDAEAYYNRGISFYYTGDYQLALKDYDKAIELDPSNQKAIDKRERVYAFVSNTLPITLGESTFSGVEPSCREETGF